MVAIRVMEACPGYRMDVAFGAALCSSKDPLMKKLWLRCCLD